jgi:hypothetical protein
MAKKNVPFLFVCLLIFSFAAGKVESTELSARLKGGADFLEWQVESYKEVKIGEEFSVIFKFKPVGATLDEVYINVTVSGEGFIFSGDSNLWALEPDTSNSWTASWMNTSMFNGVMYKKTAYLTAVEESEVYGFIEGVYYVGAERYSMYAHFDVARIYTKTNQELDIDYQVLNQSFLTLQRKYDSLETNLNNIQKMIYAFMITTAVFIVTTIYFAVRKTKAKPE